MSNSEKKESKKGEIIQRHLENVNMDPWYYIYQNYVKSPQKKEDKEN